MSQRTHCFSDTLSVQQNVIYSPVRLVKVILRYVRNQYVELKFSESEDANGKEQIKLFLVQIISVTLWMCCRSDIHQCPQLMTPHRLRFLCNNTLSAAGIQSINTKMHNSHSVQRLNFTQPESEAKSM